MISIVHRIFLLLIFLLSLSCDEAWSCVNLDNIESINLFVHRNAALNLEVAIKVTIPLKPLLLSSPVAKSSSTIQLINQLLVLLYPKFVELCEPSHLESLDSVYPLWDNGEECVADLNSQTSTWLFKTCDNYEGFPVHYKHMGINSINLDECRVVTTMAYVHIYHYRLSDNYLNAARMILPQILSNSGHCVVFFSDEVKFLDQVRQIDNVGSKSLVTRLLQPFLAEGMGLGSSRNAQIALSLLPLDLPLKNGMPLQTDLGRTLAAGIWFQKLDLCALAAELVPSATLLQWRDLGNRTNVGVLEIMPDVGSILATTYPLSRSFPSLSFDGKAPCGAHAHGSFLIMRRADALIHANTFHSKLLMLLALGQEYLDEEIVIAFAANARGCATNLLLNKTAGQCAYNGNTGVLLRPLSLAQEACGSPIMDVRDVCTHSLVECEGDWSG